MDWQEQLKAYAENEEILQVYEDWGSSEYLQELFGILQEYNPEWNKEKELGSWAAEFILDILEEVEEEVAEKDKEERLALLGELVEERYDDFRNGHQFARINNAALQMEGGAYEAIREQAAEEGEKIGFPVLI